AGAYLIGSTPFAVIVSRVMGLEDPRSYGSGNPGATNVLRSGSKVAAVLTLLGDAAKGWFAVWLAERLQAPADVVAVVATAAGVLFAIDWRVGLAVLLVWLAVVAVSRYSSLGGIVAAVFAPAAVYY